MGRLTTVEQRVTALATAHPHREAIIFLAHDGAPTSITYRGLDRRVNHCARVLASHGVGVRHVVAIALPNGIDHVVAALAAWRLGATVLALDPRSPARETEEAADAARPALFVGTPRKEVSCPVITAAAWGDGEDAEPLPSPGVPPRSALATGGSSGRPRVILRRRSWEYAEDDLPSAHDRAMGLRLDQVQLITLPLFHGGFGAMHQALVLGHTVVLTPMFIPRLVATAIERYAVDMLRLVPTMMTLLLKPGGVVDRDLSSVVAMHHGTGPCPPEVKRAWMKLLGPERVFETYGSQEQLGFVWIRGDEWLAHPGSVGRPAPGTLVIVDQSGREAPPGTVGEVFQRPATGGRPEYLGDGPALRTWRQEYFSVGDLGLLDADGYLHLKGRVQETINVGGAKVFPAEVEGVLVEYPSVVDACVLARDHPVQGQVPYAIVVSTDPRISLPDLDRHCRQRLSAHKVPVDYEVRDSLPRSDAGKLRRPAIRPDT
ncbi:MAG TPA: AMP-binding protein [Streptosporangiaceae bacterium]|nr:AMP-binding protein [Streptosporangiaceae bacterium]